MDIGFKAITFTTFGGFGEGTHELIKEATNDTEWSPNDPWVKPSPKSHACLTFGFALAQLRGGRVGRNRAALCSTHTPLRCVVARYGTYPVQEKEKQSWPPAALTRFY